MQVRFRGLLESLPDAVDGDTDEGVGQTEMTSTLDLGEAFRRTAREIVHALGADMGVAWMVTPGGESLSPLVAYQVPTEFVDTVRSSSPAPPLASELMQLRAPLHIEHSATDARLDHLFFRSIPHQSVLLVPVRSSTETIGGLAVVWARETRRLAPGQLRLVEAISRHAAVAIENAGLLDAERRSRERLALSEARYQQLFENVNDIVYVHDLAGRILEINEAGVQASGYTRDELLSMNVATLMPEADFERASAHIRRAIEGTPLAGFFPTELIRKDGGRVFLEINARVLVNDGRPAGIEGVARNVTARRRSEARYAAFVEIVRELAAEDDFETLISLISERICGLLTTDNAGFVVTKRPAGSEDMAADPHWRDSRAVRDAGYRAVLEVPVILRGDVVGVLSALHRTPRAFSAEDIGLLTALADHTAVAFDRAHLVRDLNARLAEMSGLLTVSQTVSSTLDVTEVMRRVAREAGRMLGADMVGAYLADASEDVLVPIAGYHVPEHLLEAFREFPVPLKGHEILETAWANHRPVWFEDPESDTRIHRDAWSRFPHQSALFVPMVVTERPVGGLFIVWWQKRRAFLPWEIQLVEGVARQAAIAAANSRSYHDAQRRRHEAEELADIARLLTESLDATTVARTMVDRVLVLFKADSTVLRILRPDGGLTEIARAGIPHPGFTSEVALPPGGGLAGRALREGRPAQTPDLPGEPEWRQGGPFREALLATGLHAAVSVPLHVKDKVIGVLGMAFTAVRTFSDSEISLLQALGDQAALALENARLYQDEQEARGGLRRLSQRLMEIQEAERRWLALELHDEIGQSLTALKLSLQLADASTSRSEVTPRIHDSLQLADRVLEQVRSLSLDLRPSLLDDLGLSAALRWYVPRQAERAGIVAHVAAEIGGKRLPAPIETTCFRIVQEAVTNIVRHARAKTIHVDVRALADCIELWIEDDGTGFDVEAARRGVDGGRSLGLLSMEERVSLVAGALSIDSAPGRGTRIHVTCPLTAAASVSGEARP